METSQVKKCKNEQGQKIVNEYKFVKEIGRGAFGKVKLAEMVDSETKEIKRFAVKIANKAKLKKKLNGRVQNSVETSLKTEVAIMKKFNHANLVKLYEIIDDPLDNKYYMILEYMERGSILSSSYMMYELKS